MKKVFSVLLALVPLIVSAKKPNVLFIIADDQAPLSIGGVNNSEIKTPNLDNCPSRVFFSTIASTKGRGPVPCA